MFFKLLIEARWSVLQALWYTDILSEFFTLFVIVFGRLGFLEGTFLGTGIETYFKVYWK